MVWIVNRIVVKKGIYTLSEQDKERLRKINALRKLYLIILGVILIITSIVRITFVSNISESTFADGQTFTDIEDFIEYMETPAFPSDGESFITYSDENSNETIDGITSPGYIYTADGKSVIPTMTLK